MSILSTAIANKHRFDRALLQWAQPKMNRLTDFIDDPRGQMAAFGLMGAIVGAAVGLGVVTIVLVLMPSVAGQVIVALNDTAENDPYFHTTVAAIPGTMSSNYTLLGVASLVVIVAIIVGILGGLFVGNRVQG
jgi:ABC-type antimicrobial peptide transport system permease subunit